MRVGNRRSVFMGRGARRASASNATALFARANMDANAVGNTATLGGSASSITTLLACARNLAAYYTNAAGVLSSVAVDTLRTGDRGILAEEASTNDLVRSQEFDNASWSKSNATVTADSVAAPDGTTTADRLVENTSNGNHRVTQSVGTKAAGNYAISVYAKAGERSHLDMAFSAGSNYVGTIFNLSGAGSVTRTDDGGGQIKPCRHGIEALGDGWYRCWITGRTTDSLSCSIVIGLSNGTTNSYAGSTSNGLYIWGAQFEAIRCLDDGPSSYIPTTTAGVTRPADVITFSDLTWLDGTTDTLYVEYTSRRGDNHTVLAVDATNDAVLSQDMVFRPTFGGAATINGGYGINATTKVCAKLAASDVRATCNGGTVAVNASGTALGTVAAVRVGLNLAGANSLNGHIRRIAGWKGANALTDAEMKVVAAQASPVPGVKDLGTLQEEYFQSATGMMYHWSMATFDPVGEGEQWAEGNEPLSSFAPTSDPTALDIANNWLDAAALVGAQYICPVSMHHDGFALWNSTAAPRCVADTTWGGLSAANGDFIKTLYDRAVARGFRVSLYFSIWNRKFELDNTTDNGTRRRAYTQLVKDLLSELKVLCPDLKAIWTDGWSWRIGYQQVRWQDIYEHIKTLWPNCLLIENNHENNYEQSDIITYEDGGGSPLPDENTSYAENNITIYATPTSPARHWFYNINNQQTLPDPAGGESNGASGVEASPYTVLIASRTHARNEHAHWQINVGPHIDGFIGSAEVTALTAIGTG